MRAWDVEVHEDYITEWEIKGRVLVVRVIGHEVGAEAHETRAPIMFTYEAE